jgi:hypothetical protein
MKPLIAASGGGSFWLQDGMPDVKMVSPGRAATGSSWLGLRRNDSYTVTGVTERPLLPAWVYALALLALMTFAWWREGRKI